MASGQDPLLTLLGANQQPQQQIQPPMAAPPQAGGVLPPTVAPQQPQQSPDVSSMMQQIMQKYQGPAMQKEMQTADQMGPLADATKVPQMGYHPNFQPMDSAGHVLGDVGKALLLGLSATGPGRAVQGAIYGPRVREYEAGQKQKAQQIEAAKAQSGAYGQVGESASRAIGGLAEADYRNRMAGTQERRTDIQQQRVNDTREFRNQMIDVDWSKLDEASRHNLQDEKLRGMGVEVQRDRNNVILKLGNQTATIKQSEFDAGVANKSQGFFDQIGQALGLKSFTGTGGPTTPLNTQAPALDGKTPPAKPAKKSVGGPPAGATHIGKGPDGKKHYADAQGNDLGLAE